MTPKQRVRKKYPKSFCEQNGQYVQIVNPLPYGEVEVLGLAIGTGRGDYYKAWAAADRKLRWTRKPHA